MADNCRTQSQSPGEWLQASLYLHYTRNLVWNSEPSQTWSQTFLLFGSLWAHTRTHILYASESCQCHLLSLLQGAVLTPARARGAQLPNHDKSLFPLVGLRGVVTAQMREEETHRHTARWPPSLSICRAALFHYNLWFTFKSSQKTDFNLTRFHLYSFPLAAHIRPLMFWCPCFHLQHILNVPG